jgi:hypothetical protein
MSVRQTPDLSAAARRIAFVFALVVLCSTIAVIRFAHHRVLWIAALAASVPVFAAVLGAFAGDETGEV